MEDENKCCATGSEKTENSDTTTQPTKTTSSADDDLDELLDSALEDFDKTSSAASESKTSKDDSKTATSQSASNRGATNTTAPHQTQDEMFNELFNAAMSDNAQQQMEEMMKTLMGAAAGGFDPTQFTQQPHTTPEGEGGLEFNETLQQTLGSLAQNAEELQAGVSDEDLMKMMSSMGLGEGGGGEDGGDFLPMMHQMMQNLLSKDVLYPSLKEITAKYPDWLIENKDKLESKDYERYSKQNTLMTEIIAEFEKEEVGDGEDVKKARFERILDIMQGMQELGQPPTDIVGELPPGMNFDPSGMPTFPGAPDQCSIM